MVGARKSSGTGLVGLDSGDETRCVELDDDSCRFASTSVDVEGSIGA